MRSLVCCYRRLIENMIPLVHMRIMQRPLKMLVPKRIGLPL
jgi:hypothetical protein